MDRPLFFVIDPHGRIRPRRDARSWARWMETADRHVALEQIGRFDVSTVFLGLDHEHGMSRRAVLWETMVFERLSRRAETRWFGRYRSAQAAKRGHAEIARQVSLVARFGAGRDNLFTGPKL